MKFIHIPVDFLKAIGEKPSYFRIYWVKWLSDYTQDLYKPDFIHKFRNDMSEVGKDLSIESIKEVYEYGMPFFNGGFIFSENGSKRAKKQYSGETMELAQKVLTYFNEICGSTYTPTKSNLEVINGRISEGYSISDFMRVIDKKSKQWLGTDQQKYLRPITLFAPKKFENYLNEPEIETNGKQKPSSSIDKLSLASQKAKQYFT